MGPDKLCLWRVFLENVQANCHFQLDHRILHKFHRDRLQAKGQIRFGSMKQPRKISKSNETVVKIDICFERNEQAKCIEVTRA